MTTVVEVGILLLLCYSCNKIVICNDSVFIRSCAERCSCLLPNVRETGPQYWSSLCAAGGVCVFVGAGELVSAVPCAISLPQILLV